MKIAYSMADEGQRFTYTAIGAERQTARPLATVTLRHETHEIATQGLLDTGADINVLPYSLGIELGVVWGDLPVVAGLSGVFSMQESRGIVLSASIGDLPSVRLVFAWTKLDHIPLILGRMNFFAEFDACFFQANGVFTIRPRDTANSPHW